MNLRVSRTGVLALIVFLALAVVLFIFLMGRFGGPSIGGSADYQLRAAFPDSQGLAGKSDVLIRGVKVGEVGDITVRGDRAVVRLDVQDRYAPIDRAATVRVGQKTVLGEAFVDIVPGTSRAGTLPDGARIARKQTLPAVELDEALEALDDDSMRSLRSLAGTLARGARDRATPRRVNATVGELAALTRQLRRLTATLKGQESTIAATIQDSRTVLGELGRREASVSEIVSAGRATLGAIASRNAALDAGLRELPKLLSTAEATLSEARPLLVEARPLVADLNAAAPALTPALDDLRPVARDAAQLLAGLPRLRAAALPVLDRAEGVIEVARPAVRGLEPALANLVPMVQYLAPRKRTLAAWFSQTAGLGAHGDAKGKWARFNMFVDPNTAFGLPGGVEGNSYTGPDDGESPKAYVPGSYPRLMPFKP